jgi:hypothetical protein
MGAHYLAATNWWQQWDSGVTCMWEAYFRLNLFRSQGLYGNVLTSFHLAMTVDTVSVPNMQRQRLQQRLKEQYQIEVQVTPPHSGPQPHTDKQQDISINTTVACLTAKDNDMSRRVNIPLPCLRKDTPNRLG